MKVENDIRPINSKIQIQSVKTNRKSNLSAPSQHMSGAVSANPSFTGGITSVLRFLDTSPAWGANVVDFFCMVLPRTLTDFGRGPEAGMETARRESMGTINDSAVGLYGALVGLGFALGINKLFGLKNSSIKAGDVFADSETMEMMGKFWHKHVNVKNQTPSQTMRKYLSDVLGNYEALTSDNKGGWKWSKIKKADIDKAVDILDKKVINKNLNKKELKAVLENVKSILVSSTGVENNYRIYSAGKPHTSRYSADAIVENIHKLSTLFSKAEIKKTFTNGSNVSANTFIKAMKSMNLKRSLGGVAIASAIGMSVQPINMYLTKKKTGGDGFVGGGKKDDSAKFKGEKALVAGLFGTGVLASIGNPKDLIKNLQFKGFSPTIKQLKFIYGLTIISRFMSARNENELRESTIKDVLGFVNWLILGNFVQKLTAQSLDSSLIKKQGTGILNWIQNSSLMSRDEVLHRHLGKKAFTKSGKSLGFNQMMDAVKNNKAAKKQLGILTIAQLSGYVYSGLVLGFGIPKLNIYMTNKREAQNKAKEQAQAQVGAIPEIKPQTQVLNLAEKSKFLG